MTATASLVLCSHLVLLAALPAAKYASMRWRVVVAVRLLYMLSAIAKGLQQCSMVNTWVKEGELESPCSANLWRTVVIAMLWHGTAFRLPFWHHVHIQGTAIAYIEFLPVDVCNSLPDIQHGTSLLASAQHCS